MSRAEKNLIGIPAAVVASIADHEVSIRGPKGVLTQSIPDEVSVVQTDGGSLQVRIDRRTRRGEAMAGTIHSLIRGMIQGVTAGFAKDLEISGVGFKAAVRGDQLDLSLGTSHPLLYRIPAGIQVTVQEGTKLHVAGISKQLVGQVAADIRAFFPMEPYKGKGVRIIGEFVRRKEGKKTA